eukprot:1793091-Pyramimonas_sp.AAC.1
MLGSSEFWRKCSHRSDTQAESIGENLVCMARHRAERARSSGGWVYVGDLIQRMKTWKILCHCCFCHARFRNAAI